MISAKTDKQKNKALNPASLLMKKAMQGASSRVGSARQPEGVFWARFFQPVTMDMVGSISTEMIAWVIDIMVIFIQDVLLRSYGGFSETNFKYVLHLMGYPGQPLKLEARTPADTQYERYAAFVFLITFKQASGAEPTGIIYIEDNNIDVFVPFPDSMKSDPTIKQQINEAISIISRDWAHLHHKRIVTRVFSFPSNFVQSNLWVPYFLLMRLVYPFATVQELFLKEDLHHRLQEKAFFSYFWMGKLISHCVYEAKKRGFPSASGSNGAYDQYFSPKSKAKLIITDYGRTQLRKMFLTCKLAGDMGQIKWLNDLKPIDATDANENWPDDIHKKWKKFIPVPNASKAQYYF